MKKLIALLLLCPAAALATKPAHHPVHSSVASASSDVSVISDGGQSAVAVGGDRSTTVALGNTAPIPLHDTPACYLPAKGIKRIRRVLFGALDFDPRLMRDEGCYQELVARRAHELALIEAEAKLEQARAERIKAEADLPATVGK